MLTLTMALGAVFLGVKGVEYYHKYEESHIPGPAFHFSPPEHFRHAQIFFSLYFVMTGLHALHMIVGLGVMAWMWCWAWTGRITRGVQQPDRDQRPVLALRGHRVDIPVSAALPARPSWVTTSFRRASTT